MKIKENFKIRKIGGENLIISQGETHSDLTKIISLNSTALYLWEELKNKDFTVESAAQLLVDKYGVSKATALSDVEKWIDKMTAEGVME